MFIQIGTDFIIDSNEISDISLGKFAYSTEKPYFIRCTKKNGSIKEISYSDKKERYYDFVRVRNDLLKLKKDKENK